MEHAKLVLFLRFDTSVKHGGGHQRIFKICFDMVVRLGFGGGGGGGGANSGLKIRLYISRVLVVCNVSEKLKGRKSDHRPVLHRS